MVQLEQRVLKAQRVTRVIVATRVGGRGPRTFYRVRLPAQTKAEGMKICDRLRRAGGACLVLPN